MKQSEIKNEGGVYTKNATTDNVDAASKQASQKKCSGFNGI
jgi:hypothetical protein